MVLGLGSFSAFVEPDSGLGTVAHSTARLLTEVPVLVHVKATITGKRVWSPRPPTFALTGAVHLLGLSAEFLFRKDPEEHLTPNQEYRATAAIVSAGHAIPIPPQPLSFTPRAESDLWVRVSDPSHQPPWTEHFGGRCPGQPLKFDRHLSARGTVDASFTPEEFAGGSRTRVRIDGELRFERGVTMRFLLRDPGQKSPASADIDVGEAVLVPAGTAVTIGKHAVWGLVGPNPWITLRILDASGKVVGDEHMLGRSVRMRR